MNKVTGLLSSSQTADAALRLNADTAGQMLDMKLHDSLTPLFGILDCSLPQPGLLTAVTARR